jgi:hypothetical protein
MPEPRPMHAPSYNRLGPADSEGFQQFFVTVQHNGRLEHNRNIKVKPITTVHIPFWSNQATSQRQKLKLARIDSEPLQKVLGIIPG